MANRLNSWSRRHSPSAKRRAPGAYPTVTRDPFRNRGRITDLITSGKLFSDAGLAPLAPEHDRVMICGSPALLNDTRALLSAEGFVEGNHGEPGQFVVEKAFAER